MKRVILVLVVGMFSLSLLSLKGEKAENLVVLELFTSQGCSSCPSADNVLKKIAKQYDEENVLALSYHVDYWNYIGWDDIFSKKIYTQKQAAYANKFRSSLYTPQLVFNGKEHLVGSKAGLVYAKLRNYLKKTVANQVALNNVVTAKGKVKFDYQISGELNNRKLRYLLVINDRITQVTRGENSNRTLENSNVVVNEITTKAKYSKGSLTIEIPDIVKPSDQLTLMVIVQKNDLEITGGTKKKLY